MTITTNDRGEPTAELTLTSPKGTKVWIFVLRPGEDDPELIHPAEPTEPEPQWVTAAVLHWVACVNYLRRELKLREDEARRTRTIIANTHDLARLVLQYDLPGGRKIVDRQAAQLGARLRTNALPHQLRAVYLESTSRLYADLRQFDPRYIDGADGPTPETAAKLCNGADSPVDQLDPMLGAVATGIRSIWRALTAKLDAKAVNLQGGGGSMAHSYEQPLEGMHSVLADEYLANYRPWAQELGIRRALPHRTASCFQVVMSMIVDDWSFEQTERHFHLPPNMAKSMLFKALRTYGSESWTPRPLDKNPEKSIACGRA